MSPPAPRIRIITLGHCAVETIGGDGQTLLFGPGKPFALLAFLACTPGRSATREFLLDLLWSDTDADHARNALRQLVWLVRNRLREETLIADGDRLTLSPAVTVDRDDLLAAVARGDTAGAVALYAGPFLPDLATPGGAEFEHWADVERQHLHSVYIRAAELRARELLDAGRTGEAVALAQELRSRDRSREGSWRLLLEALLADRNLLGAAVEADALSRALAAEHRTPERSTQRLLDQCRNGAPDAADGSASDRLVADLVGRAAEFGAAMRLWRSAQAGALQHLHLTGQPGSGKTRLLDDVAARLRAGGARVVVVRARMGERAAPGAALADLVRALAAVPGATGVPAAVAEVLIGLEPGLADRFPGVRGRFTDPSDAWRLRASATRDLIASVVSERPLVLVIDDLQWIDAQSRGALESALERLTDGRTLLLTAARLGYDGHRLTPDAAEFQLRPLDVGQVAEMLASIASFDDDAVGADLAERICRAADGVPLQVLDTIRALSDRGHLRLVGRSWRIADPAALARALDGPIAFAERIGALPPEAQRLLDVVAVAPVPVPRKAGIALVGTTPEAGQEVVDALVRQGLVLDREGGLEPAHDRIRERVVAAMDDGARRTAEREACRWLASDPELPLRQLPAVVAPLVTEGVPPEVRPAYERWMDAHRTLGDRRSDRDLARELLGVRASDAIVRQLLRRRPLARRLGGAPALAAGLVLAVAGGGWAFTRYAGRPAQLSMIVHPVGWGGPAVGLVPAPVVEIQDRLGRRVYDDSEPVTIAATPDRLMGPTTVRAVRGRATFNGLAFGALSEPDSVTVTVRTRDIGPLRLTYPVRNDDDSLTVVRGRLAGQELDPADPVVRVRPGALVTGSIDFDYTTRWAAAAVMLGAVATWRRGPSEVITQLPLITPIEHGRSALPLRFTAPKRPGTYHLVFAYNAEPDAKWIASGTNWILRRPAWGGETDISRWNEATLDTARRTGRAMVHELFAYGRRVENVPSRVVDVVVE